MADFILKGKIDEYQGKLDMLNGCLSDLEGLKAEYYSHLDLLTDVMEETDDNFQHMEDVALENIQSLNESIKATNARKESVQAAVTAMNEIDDTVRSALNTASETAASVINAAVKTAQTLL